MKTEIDWKTNNASGHATAVAHAWIDWRLSEGDRQIIVSVNEKPTLKISIVNSSDIGPELIVEENKVAETKETMAACQRAAGIVGKYDALLEAHNAVGEILNSGRRFILQMKALEAEDAKQLSHIEALEALLNRLETVTREEIDDYGSASEIDRIAFSLLLHEKQASAPPNGLATRSIDRLVWLQEHVFPGSFVSAYREEIAGKRFRAEITKIGDESWNFSSEASSECLARLAVVVRAKLFELRTAQKGMTHD